jgi:hypothetical protein
LRVGLTICPRHIYKGPPTAENGELRTSKLQLRRGLLSSMMLVAFAILFGLSLAQRPTNSSTCDYYAQSLYGANNGTTQFQLIQGIIALAFGGGFNLSNVSSEITGIFNPGTFQNLTVDLRPWFNGSIDSTNLNNQPVGINWLDGGGTDPLYNFLSGQTPNVVLVNTTNE